MRRMKGTTPTTRTPIPLTDDLRARLRAEAEREERSMAWLAAKLLEEALAFRARDREIESTRRYLGGGQ